MPQVGTAQHLGGLVITDDLLGPGVPAQFFPFQAHRDISQMADGNRAVGDFNGRGRRLARDHAVDEIAEMVVALVEMNLFGPDFGIEQGLGIGFEHPAVDVDLSLGPLEGHPHFLFVRDDHVDAVIVNGLERIFGGGVPEFVGRKNPLGVPDLDWTCHFGTHPPLGTIGVVAAPVGHLAAGVVVDPAEVDVAASPCIGSLGGGPSHILNSNPSGTGSGFL